MKIAFIVGKKDHAGKKKNSNTILKKAFSRMQAYRYTPRVPDAAPKVEARETAPL